MNIGDGNNSSGLLERMREAYRQEEARAVDEIKSGDQSGASAPAEGLSAGNATGSQASSAVVKLEQRLLSTAENALDDAYDSTDEVRRAVVEAIVSERYAETLGPAQTEQVTRTLELTLSDDPVFRDEVDNMLLHAARQLARGAD